MSFTFVNNFRGIGWHCVLLMLLINLLNAQSLIITPRPAYFGKIPVGSESSGEVSIYNISNSSVTISRILILGSSSSRFSITNNPGSITLRPLEKINLNINYIPVSSGRDEAFLEVQSNVGTFRDTLFGFGTLILDAPTFERIIRVSIEESEDTPGSIKRTSDGGYIIVGSTLSVYKDYSDFYILKTDQNGKPIWSKILGGSYQDHASDILEVDDGYIIAGASDSYGNGTNDIVIFKISKSGDSLWFRSYPTRYDEVAFRIIEGLDGGYIVCGYTKNTADGSVNALVMKVDSKGNLIWKKDYGERGGEIAYDIKALRSGCGYVFTGLISDMVTGKSDIYLVKINCSGDMLWYKKLGGPEDDVGYGIDITDSGGFIICGYTASYGNGGRDAYILKVDSIGNPLWSRTFGTAHNDQFSDVIQAQDGGYICVGYINTYFSLQFIYNDLIIVKFNESGELLLQAIFGGSLDDYGVKVIKASDYGYTILGGTSSFTPRRKVYLLQVNLEGKITNINFSTDRSIIKEDDFIVHQNYPNPFNSSTWITYSIKDESFVTIKVYDVMGREVCTIVDAERKPAGIYTVEFNGFGLPSGVYFYRIFVSDKHAFREGVVGEKGDRYRMVTKGMVLLK